MIRTRTRKIISDIWSRKIRTLLVSSSIFIGVLGVVTLVSAGELLINQLEQDIQEDKLAMIRAGVSVRVFDESVREIDNDPILDEIRQLDGVAVVEGRTVNEISYRDNEDDGFNTGLLFTTYEDPSASQLEPLRVVEGRFPILTPDSAGLEIAIGRAFADERGLGIGDTLQIRLLRPATENLGDAVALPTGGAAQVVDAEIVGIVFQAYSIPGTLGSTDALIVTQFDDAAFILNSAALSFIYVRYDDFAQTEDGQAILTQAIDNSLYTGGALQPEDPAENGQIEQTRSTNQVLVTLAVIALIVSGFLVVNVLTAIISEQRRQIGAMKSLGATTADNFYIYSGIALGYGIIGVVPGVLLGIPAGYFAAQALAAQNGTEIESFGISSTGIVAGGVIGLLIPFLASIIPVFLGTRVSILAAITDQGISSNFGRGRLEQLLGNAPLPLGLRQSINNSFQKKGRLALTGITLMLANAAFMGIFSIFFGLVDFADRTFATYGYQINVVLPGGQNIDEVEETLRTEVSGLRDIEPAIETSIVIDGYDAPTVTAGPPGVNGIGYNTNNPDLYDFTYLDGDGWQNDPSRNGIVVANVIRDSMELEIGDEITVSAGGGTQTFEVIGVVSWPFPNAWFRFEQLAEMTGLVAADGSYLGNRIQIIMEAEDPSSQEVFDKIDEIKETFLVNGENTTPQNLVDLNETIVQIVTILGVILSLAAFLIAAVGGVGLLTTLSISVFERQKEIGVMRSVGATSWAVASQFLIEGLIVGVVSFLIALPASLVLRAFLLTVLPIGNEEGFNFDYPLFTPIVGLVAILFLVTVSSLWPSFSASRRTVSDILRYQ